LLDTIVGTDHEYERNLHNFVAQMEVEAKNTNDKAGLEQLRRKRREMEEVFANRTKHFETIALAMDKKNCGSNAAYLLQNPSDKPNTTLPPIVTSKRKRNPLACADLPTTNHGSPQLPLVPLAESRRAVKTHAYLSPIIPKYVVSIPVKM
jgi:hypothetical protein